MSDRQRWPCTPYCSEFEPCAAECEQGDLPRKAISEKAATIALDLSIGLQGAIGEQCFGHLELPSGGGLRCRRIATHPDSRGPFSRYPTEQHVYGVGPGGGEIPSPRTWTDHDMGAVSHREWWGLYAEGEMRRQRIAEERRESTS